jgi:hypothetical protein
LLRRIEPPEDEAAVFVKFVQEYSAPSQYNADGDIIDNPSMSEQLHQRRNDCNRRRQHSPKPDGQAHLQGLEVLFGGEPFINELGDGCCLNLGLLFGETDTLELFLRKHACQKQSMLP